MPPRRPSVSMSTTRRLTRRGVLWLGLRCDMRCKFCYDRHIPRADKIWIGRDEAIAALDKFRQFYGNQFVDFMGGEPTMHPSVLDLVCHAAGIGLFPTIITHGLRLEDPGLVRDFVDAGLHDVRISIHGVGATATAIHGRGENTFDRQLRALENLRSANVPVRFNCTLIRDNLTQLERIVDLASQFAARAVNFIVFNPAFEWASDTGVSFQPRHGELASHLARAIDRGGNLGMEVNARYLPLCQLPGYEAHLYTGHQSPYDPHEWDFNSWYDHGHPGQPSAEWYRAASLRQRRRHQYTQVSACGQCAAASICDGFHTQYVARWGGDEAVAYPGIPVTDPCHYISQQSKIEYGGDDGSDDGSDNGDNDTRRGRDDAAITLTATQFDPRTGHRAGIRSDPPGTDQP